MFLTAQRVVSPKDGSQGINAYCYTHEPETLADGDMTAALDRPPGLMVRERVVIPPPGNRVRSFLDVVGPNSGTLSEAREAFEEFKGELPHGHSVPWSGLARGWAFRFLCESALVPVWERELGLLFEALSPLVASPQRAEPASTW